MAIVDHDAPVPRAQPLDLGVERRVIGVEPARPPRGDLVRRGRGAVAVQRLAVEGGGGAELRRGLAGVERHAGGIAVDVDGGARHGGVDGRGAEIGGEAVEPVDPPVGVLARQPGRDEPRRDLRRQLRPGVGEADDERRFAAPDGEPGGGHRVAWGRHRVTPMPLCSALAARRSHRPGRRAPSRSRSGPGGSSRLRGRCPRPCRAGRRCRR